ncbi:MAG: hypothetical protein KME10_10060 [Plectolyngbya sp. WJT66-NPBG17]|jgi:hypothetical protein|nr:hypothetical protein [Plectolyngbya sp. WJT66-NPBG17]MBW4525593.1 hypothetical protein [Phormidium tanganyikae FI6-MK23]
MPQLTVSFSHIDVHDDADNWPNGTGEIYYDLLISNQSIVSRPSNNPQNVDSGGVILINEQRTLNRPNNDPNAFVKINGWVSEADDFLSGGDDRAGGFEHIHNAGNGWGVGTHDARLRGDGLDVTVHYNISVVQDSGL